jgi:bifunctional UDP-N-acetylglucosamine pyrophosphorylase/glucosamine-1-phosphate N-acetyltransferase
VENDMASTETSSKDFTLLILAAGEGTRMRSRVAKVLHPLCGVPMIEHVIRTGRAAGARRVVIVIGSAGDQVRAALADAGVEFVVQSERLGTAHAVLQARELCGGERVPILISSADQPLFRPETYAALLEDFRRSRARLSVLTSLLPDPSGYGRIVRGADGRIERIVEHRDASPEIRLIRESNLCVYMADPRTLFELLPQVGNRNEKHEYYLTDVVALALDAGHPVEVTQVPDWRESLGINSRLQLAQAEAALRHRIAQRWMEQGVSFEDPERTYVGADVEIGPDTVLAPGVSLRGRTRIGAGCRIAEHSVIEDSVLGDECWIKPHCHLEQSELGARVVLGPSAHLRPGARLCDDVRVGNFVEIKNSTLGRGTKADHLAYIGDADLGEKVSMGCGSIVVNYDSEQKHRTRVHDRAFVGCNVNLISPVEIEEDAYLGAGSTITKRVPRGALGIARARQTIIEGWRERRFKKSGSGGED